jgi:general secretion pathway protein M
LIHWWRQLAERERRLLAITAAVVVVFVCWLGIWRPLDRMHQDTSTQLERQRAEIQWMRAAAQEVARLKSGKPLNVRDRGNQSLLALAEQTARQAGLGSAFRRGEPAATDQVRIWLEGADFDALISWLDKLESERGVSVLDSDLERTAIAGQVSARLLLTES